MQIDWCASLETLRQRYGTTFDADYAESYVTIPTPLAPLARLFKPLSVTPSETASAALPPSQLWGVFYHGPDAHTLEYAPPPASTSAKDSVKTRLAAQIFDEARASLEALLGNGENSSVSNTNAVRWQAGNASVELTTWPHHLNRDWGNNVFHQREPRLAHATSLSITTGFSLQAQPEDIARVRACHPVRSLRGAPVDLPGRGAVARPVAEREREFTRQFPQSLAVLDRLRLRQHTDSVCLCADGSVLVIPRATGAMLIPVERIAAVHVSRCLPARGSGYSQLGVRCTTDFGRGPVRLIDLLSAPGSDDLNATGQALAQELRCTCELGAYFADD